MRIISLLGVLAALLLPASVCAQVLPLDSVLNAIATAHPELKMYDARIQAYDAYTTGARALDPPSVGGGFFMTIAALNTLWVEAQAYPMDRKRIRQGMSAEVRLPARPGLALSGTISFLNPALDASTIIDPVRIAIPNTDGELRPGMQAYVRIILQQDTVLAVPTNAVLWDGQGATVWVRTGHNIFKSVMVNTGMEADDFTEIISGLQRGDAVVISGAYLLNSEYKFKSGTDPMSGMKM